MNQEFKDIVDEVKYKYRITQAEMAERLGLTRSYISEVINGRAPFNDTLRQKIEDEFGLNKKLDSVVRDAVTKFMRANSYSVDIIAQRLGLEVDTVICTLDLGFDRDSARMWAQAFGFNEEFLLTGEGAVMRSDATTVPLIPIEAHAGHLADFAESVMSYDCERVVSPVRNAEMAIPITGESMSPEFPSGSVVFIRKINEKIFIEWGKAYVLDTTNGPVIKYLAPGHDDGYVKCISANQDPKYAPFEIPLSEVLGVYRIVNLLCTK